MGSWGTGLYSDDTACDVRDNYKDFLGDGITEPEATQRMIQRWKISLSDPGVACVFWLALSDVQWNLGRLQEQVKEQALDIIQNGTDLKRWEYDALLESKRAKVLHSLQLKLDKPQPAEKKVKNGNIPDSSWKIGEVYSFQLESGNKILLHVIGFHKDRGGRGPVCEVLDWYGNTPPKRKVIKKMGYIYAKPPSQHLSQFKIGSLSEKDYPGDRIKLEAKRIRPKQEPGGFGVFLWGMADELFEKFFGFR